jgi:hypothetical protein
MRLSRVALSLTTIGWIAPALAEDRCVQFSWSLGQRIDLFAEKFIPTIDSGQYLPKEGVFAVRLKRASDIVYPVTPERGSDSGYGGVVTIESLPAGRYQVALSAEAWVDAVQEHKRLTALNSDNGGACPGVKRRWEYRVQGEPLTLQIGGASAAKLNVALVRLWDFERKWQ